MATPTNANPYYQGIYWNDHPEVVRYLNLRACDEEATRWFDFLLRRNGSPFRRALSLNCGNGWVERDLVRAGVVTEIVAVDYLETLLNDARRESVGLPINFVQADVNKAQFPPGPFDLVINHAAGHHITYLDRVFRRIRELLEPNGMLVMWDYTGPHRNQYHSRIWNEACRVNDLLPSEYRARMNYPHLPTMLVDDPTEAIHSELLLETVSRYFRFEHLRPLGGCVAYPILTHNNRVTTAPPDLRASLVEQVVIADQAHTNRFPEDSLFTFAIASPRDKTELDEIQMTIWASKEALREEISKEHGGLYYLPTAIAELTYPSRSTEATSSAQDLDVVESSQISLFSVALLGPKFAIGALVRSIALKFPRVIPALRFVRRKIVRRG